MKVIEAFKDKHLLIRCADQYFCLLSTKVSSILKGFLPVFILLISPFCTFSHMFLLDYRKLELYLQVK